MNMDTAVLENRVRERQWLGISPIEATKKKSFEQAVAECNGVTVEEFFDELNARIEKWTDNA